MSSLLHSCFYFLFILTVLSGCYSSFPLQGNHIDSKPNVIKGNPILYVPGPGFDLSELSDKNIGRLFPEPKDSSTDASPSEVISTLLYQHLKRRLEKSPLLMGKPFSSKKGKLNLADYNVIPKNGNMQTCCNDFNSSIDFQYGLGKDDAIKLEGLNFYLPDSSYLARHNHPEIIITTSKLKFKVIEVSSISICPSKALQMEGGFIIWNMHKNIPETLGLLKSARPLGIGCKCNKSLIKNLMKDASVHITHQSFIKYRKPLSRYPGMKN